MSEQVGDHEGSAPFKEGTIKYACYEVLKHAGPGGLTVAEIVHHIRDGCLAKLGGATPANTIVGQLSKDANFSLVCKATYALRTDIGALDSFVSERTGFQSASRKRKYPSDSEVSGCSAARLFYRPGAAVEMLGKCAYDPTLGRGGEWCAATVVAVENENVTIRLETENDTSTDRADTDETFNLTSLAKRVRPIPPRTFLSLDGRAVNEEVDVLLNKVWTEGVVVKVAEAGGGQQKITVALPKAQGDGSQHEVRDVVVFSDSSGQMYARDMFQKRGAKVSGLRRGWAFSGTAGQWLVRGAAMVVTSERSEHAEASAMTASGVFASGLPSHSVLSHGPRVGHNTRTRLEAGSACASPRRRVRGERPPPAPDFSKLEFGASNRLGGDYRLGNSLYGHGESSHSAGYTSHSARYDPNVVYDPNSPPFKSLSDACRSLLLDAGKEGLQVSEMVRVIQQKNLVKLGGRTPSNTVYSRLSQDMRFMNVARGAYALAEVVNSDKATTNSPPRFDGVARNDCAGVRGGEEKFKDDGDTGSVHGDDLFCAEGGDEIFGRRKAGGEEVKNNVNNHDTQRRVSGRRRDAPVQPNDQKKTGVFEPPPRATMADSSAFSVDQAPGVARVQGADASVRGGDDDADVELSAETLLMGLRSGTRGGVPVSR